MRDALERLRAWLFAPADRGESPTIDTDYVAELQYVNVDTGTEECRCALCGLTYPTESFPELLEHVATHDEQGAAEIDPFQTGLPVDTLQSCASEDEPDQQSEHEGRRCD